ncbi:MAG: hypothetical protein LKF79_02680 [Solobacterium sp.]|jgi:uridine kinase|nr:hypothetical protein [Solobacterium sp.]MCH4222328.1 hypothetical protein [Solobacterium sp.]MCH4265533.1 hypothetical protein [Solobacterium sp.]
MKITVQTRDNEPVVMEYDHPVTAETIIRDYSGSLPHEILACRINNYVSELDEMISSDCVLDLLDMRDNSASITYEVSLTLLYIKAVHDVLGKDVKVTIANSLSKGFFTQIHTGGLTDDTAKAIEQDMKQLVEKNLPIERVTATRRQMLENLKDGSDPAMLRLVKDAPDLTSARNCRLGDESGFFYHSMVPSTGYLKWFEVRRYKNGFLLRFPQTSSPDALPEYREQKLLYEQFSQATRWDRVMGIEDASGLNELVLKDDYKDVILLSEALHEKRIAELAESIRQSGKRMILIAGPSSSGKTSFAKRLCIQLRVIGLKPLYLGTDDFFLEREETPADEHGDRNYEDLSALDINLFAEDMTALLKGKKVDLPEYDFLIGKKVYGKRITSIEPCQPIVIEGIHGLNPKLTEVIPDDQKFRIYISPLTQLNIDDHNRIPTTDARMLRRIVRDYQFRGYSAAATIHSWPSVRAGERKNIFPFTDQADASFNSYCLYELAVLKKYAEPQLKKITPDQPEYPEAQRMLEFLAFFVAIQDDSMIPNNSIMREFIGGSVLL